MPGDADDDGDDIAIDGGMEPESATGDAPGGGDDDDAYDDGDGAVATGGAVSRVISPSRTLRPVSDKTRALFKQAADKIKASAGEGDDLEPLEYDDLPAESAPVAAAPGAAGVEPLGAPAGGQAPPPVPPATSLAPEIVKLREELDARGLEMDAREKRLLDAERTSDITKLRDVYYEKGAPAVVEIIKKWAGTTTEDELKDEIADLVSDLSHQFLGVAVPTAIKEQIENRRTRKGIKVWKADQERAAQEQAEKQKAAQDEQNRVRVRGILHQEITKPEHVAAYPWLAAEPNAGEIVFDVIEAAHTKEGTRLTWQEAAKRANDYLQQQSLSWIDKRKHLLTTASGQGAKPSGQQQRTQGDPQVRRSQAPPATPPATPPPKLPKATVVAEGKWDPEAHRKSVKSRFRNAFTRTDEE